MKLFRDFASLPDSAKGAVVALGNFDGLHLGHQAILNETLAQAKALNAPAAVMTFSPHPREFFAPTAPKLRLMRAREKIARIGEMGFSTLFIPHFNVQLAATSAENFIENILVGQLGVRYVVTGEDFCFGAKRKGNAALLAQSAAFGYSAVPHITQGLMPVSSTTIRQSLAEGNLAQAAQLLGRPYSISGHVTHGDKRGRTLGFPTANIPMEKLFLPRNGVYAVHVEGVGRGVANIGTRPTVGGKEPRAEIHLFDFSGDLYGKYLHVELKKFLRDEKQFPSLEALKSQIVRDCEEAKKS